MIVLFGKAKKLHHGRLIRMENVVYNLDRKDITFVLEDLIGRVVRINSLKDKDVELIVAVDINTGEIFVLKEIRK